MELEVSHKVRAAIKAKLVELGVHVDEELPDYVMVLIANRRTKESVEKDLQLFLNENTMKFSNWLFSVLKKLEEVTINKIQPKEPVKPIASSPEKEPEAPPKERSKEIEKVSSSTKRKSNELYEAQSSKTDRGSAKRAKFEEKVEIRSKVERVEIRYDEPDQPNSSSKDRNTKAFGDVRRSQRKISVIPPRRRSSEERFAGRSRSRSPPRRHSPVRFSPPTSISRRGNSPPPRRFQFRKDIKERLEERRRKARSPRTRSRSPDEGRIARKSLKSLVGAVVRTQPKESANNDEEYDPRRPAVNSSVTSVVKVGPRPRRESQLNNKLVLLAMADAQKSIVTKSIQSKSIHTKLAEVEKKEESIKISFDATSNINEHSGDGSSEYIPLTSTMFKSTFKPSIKDRLGERRQRREELEEGNDDLEIELDAETYQKDVASKEDLQMIVVKVPSSASNNQRNVTMGELSNTIKPVSNPNSFKIQVNVSDDSSSEYDNDSEEEKESDEKQKATPVVPNENSNDKKSSDEEEIIIEEVMVETDDDGEAYDMNDRDLEAERTRILKSRRTHKKKEEKVEKMEESDEEFVCFEEMNGIPLPEPDFIERRLAEEKMDTKENKSSSFSSSMDERLANSADVSPEKINVIMNQPKMLPIPMTTSNMMHSPQSTKFVITMNEEDMGEGMMISHDDHISSSNDLRNRIQGVYSQQGNFLSSDVHPIYRTIDNTQRSQKPRPFGAGPAGPFNSGITPKVPAGTTGCKYWPNCTFKDKCAYPHPSCMFGVACTKRDCPYKHPPGIRSQAKAPPPPPSPTLPPQVDEGKIICKFFPKCHTMSCTFFHPSPCRFGVGCTDPKCLNYHPGKTVGQTRVKPAFIKGRGGITFHQKPPAAHLLKWVAPTVPKP